MFGGTMKVFTVVALSISSVVGAANLDAFKDPKNVRRKRVDENTDAVGNIPGHNVAPNNLAPNNVAPDNVAPINVAPNNIAPNNVAPNNVAPNNVAPKNVALNNPAQDNIRYIEPLSKTEPDFRTTAWACPEVDVEALSKSRNYLKSQGGEDQCLLGFFNGICGGKYMEMGALDGKRFSNTYAFYSHPGLNWRGVNVEMIPSNYEQLVLNRPLDIANIHAAVCDEPQTLHYVDTSDKVNAVSGIWEFASDAHKEQWFGGKGFNETATIPIHCSPLQDILDKAVGKDKFFFDFYSLDIEGAEYSALKGIDFDRTGFGILIVERNKDAPEETHKVVNFLRSKGYDRFTKQGCAGRNIWYINRDFDKIYGKILGTEQGVKNMLSAKRNSGHLL